MSKSKLYWEYYKSTLALSLSSSVIFAFIISEGLKNLPIERLPLYVIFLFCFMFGGAFAAFFYKEVSRKGEYYFYYNRGISKMSLWVITEVTNILIGGMLINILNYVELARN
jgi:hypothetical protein